MRGRRLVFARRRTVPRSSTMRRGAASMPEAIIAEDVMPDPAFRGAIASRRTSAQAMAGHYRSVARYAFDRGSWTAQRQGGHGRAARRLLRAAGFARPEAAESLGAGGIPVSTGVAKSAGRNPDGLGAALPRSAGGGRHTAPFAPFILRRAVELILLWQLACMSGIFPPRVSVRAGRRALRPLARAASFGVISAKACSASG